MHSEKTPCNYHPKQWGLLPTTMTGQSFPGMMFCLLPASLLAGRSAACPLLKEVWAVGCTRLCVFAYRILGVLLAVTRLFAFLTQHMAVSR